MRALLVLLAASVMRLGSFAAANDPLSVRTNFVPDATLSSVELRLVVGVANLCGVKNVEEINTARHLGGFTIQVNGDETFEGRSVTFNSLQVHRSAWERRDRPTGAETVGEFWAEPAKLRKEERTIVEVGGQKIRVGLLNGIKPTGADQIVGAFVGRRVRFANDNLKDALSRIDVRQPTWIGISGDKLWITFSAPGTRFVFTLNGDEVKLLDRIQMYE